MDDPDLRADISPEKDEPEDPYPSSGTPNGHPVASQGPNGANGSIGLFGRLKSMIGLKTSNSLRDNLENALRDEETDEETTFTPEERLMLRNILRMREIRLDDVMVPRADIDAVDDTVSLGQLVKRFRESGHSRMPVYTETLDDPRGLVHIKDVMTYITDSLEDRTGEEAPAVEKTEKGSKNLGEPGSLQRTFGQVDFSTKLTDTNLIRSVLFVPPSMPTTDLMAKMQANRMQLALVIDEYGGTDGLVSLEDIVETVVGDIVDEHDDDEAPMIISTGEGIWIADARIDLEDAVEAIGEDFEVSEASEDVDTLGGLLFTLIGRIPVRGELISSPELPGYEMEILDADPRRIKRLRIYQRRPDGLRRPPRREKGEDGESDIAT